MSVYAAHYFEVINHSISSFSYSGSFPSNWTFHAFWDASAYDFTEKVGYSFLDCSYNSSLDIAVGIFDVVFGTLATGIESEEVLTANVLAFAGINWVVSVNIPVLISGLTLFIEALALCVAFLLHVVRALLESSLDLVISTVVSLSLS